MNLPIISRWPTAAAVGKICGMALGALVFVAGCSEAPNESPDHSDAVKRNTSTGAPCVVDRKGDEVPTAPDSERVDLYHPSFTSPLNVTNPLFPISSLQSAILLGVSDRQVLRVEVTLLPSTKSIDLGGEVVQTLESQYVAYIDGRLAEVALDWYGQDDLGAVWYFGEDVFNYDNGIFADNGGTWLAGADGPAAMIMPANPQVGDVYRPENICGLVFEEVTVQATGLAVAGPTGPVSGAILIEELHMDAGREDKYFAPGYGEFSTGSGKDVEAIALAVPEDALGGAIPDELEDLVDGADDIFNLAESGDWRDARETLDQMLDTWESYRAVGVPPLLDTQMANALTLLRHTIVSHKSVDAREAAIEVARAAYDLQLRHRPISEIDIARFELRARQILVDVEEADPLGVSGDITVLEWVLDRFAHSLGGAELASIESLLDDLRQASDDDDLEEAATLAQDLRDEISGL